MIVIITLTISSHSDTISFTGGCYTARVCRISRSYLRVSDRTKYSKHEDNAAEGTKEDIKLKMRWVGRQSVPLLTKHIADRS